MFYVKSDDMDDLFKKAAENCELNEELAADWNKVHAALQLEESTDDFTKVKKKRRRFIFFWWWLFIPVILFISYSIGIFNGEKTQQKQQTNSSSPIEKTNEQKQTFQKNDADLKIETEKNNVVRIQNSKNPATSFVKPNATLNTISEKSKMPALLPKTQPFTPEVKTNYSTKSKTDSSTINEMNTSLNKKVSEIISNKSTSIQTKDSIVSEIKNERISGIRTNEAVATKAPAKNQQLTDQKKKKNTIDFTRQAYWILGITTNTDISFVKNQQTSKVGYGGGIVAGYHLKNGLSIQTGLLFDKKNYYTSGQYFDTKRIALFQASGTTLNFANGNCKMWEIPLNINYDFKRANKIGLFVTAGISSYLMQNEYYNFNYNLNRYAYDSGYNYPRSSKNYFAILNVGAGANIQASKNLFIQVQPYFKVPLKGVGIGNLSLKSAGLNISLVKHIH